MAKPVVITADSTCDLSAELLREFNIKTTPLTIQLGDKSYQDGVDFVWNTSSKDLAQVLGLLTYDELAAIQRDGFKRDHVALISYRALGCALKDGSGTLADRLVDAGVFTWAGLDAAEDLIR